MTKEEIIEQERKQFIESLVKARLKANLTVYELSKLTGIAQPNISRIEKGDHSVGLDTIIKIIMVLEKKIKLVSTN